MSIPEGEASFYFVYLLLLQGRVFINIKSCKTYENTGKKSMHSFTFSKLDTPD